MKIENPLKVCLVLSILVVISAPVHGDHDGPEEFRMNLIAPNPLVQMWGSCPQNSLLQVPGSQGEFALDPHHGDASFSVDHSYVVITFLTADAAVSYDGARVGTVPAGAEALLLCTGHPDNARSTITVTIG